MDLSKHKLGESW